MIEFQDRRQDDVKGDAASTYDTSENERHQERHQNPELAAVIEAWATLPEAIRAGILAMVEASVPRPQNPDGTR